LWSSFAARFQEKEEWMAKPSSRVSGVLMTGPLAPFEDAYRAELFDRGYAPLWVVNGLRQLARFSRWLEAEGLTVAEVTEARVEEFFEWQRVNWRHRKSWSGPALRCLLDVLRGLGVVAAEEPAVPSSPTVVLLAGLSATCSPSGGWRRARWRCTWRARAGSWRACRRIARLLV
jgi:hypothetical protein